MTSSSSAWISLAIAALLLGMLIGALLAALRSRNRHAVLTGEIVRLQAALQGQEALANERAVALAQAEDRLAAVFGRLADESLSRNSEVFLRLAQENLLRHQERAGSDLAERQKAVAELIKPIGDALDKATRQIAEIEKERSAAFGGIKAQLVAMAADQQLLQAETRNLVNALRRPEVRGRWGEMTLRRVAELAGMVEHCDFVEQTTVSATDSTIRPDMVVRLPDRGELVVDVKTPLDAYIEAIEAHTEQDRKTALQRHARNVAERVRELSAKAYWAQFATSPEFVILFIPGDQFLSAALSENPGLLEDALRNKVVLATPSSLVALLKAIAYGWRQLSLAQNAEQVRRLGQDLYERLAPFTTHLARLGRQLEGSVRTFNEAVGSLERKVLPGARRLAELGISGRHDLESPSAIETLPRSPSLAPGTSELPGK
ncbi:MAG: DNA recombination protein RmuC [Gammaproteobacteria bacterium]|nr:DNA recombination protein RmuC [Gammaproteobacteria bacterium]